MAPPSVAATALLAVALAVVGSVAASPLDSDSAGAPAAEISRPEAAHRLQRTLAAVEAALRFLGDGVGDVNLDGGIGVRTVEGQFGALLARYWTQLPMWAAAMLRRLQLLAANVGDDIAESVRRRTPAYFDNAGQMLQRHFWETFYPTATLPLRPPPPTPPKSQRPLPPFSEKFSDDCIREFYASDARAACSISPHCWNTMVAAQDTKGYFLTHQLFYLMNGIQANCAQNLTLMASRLAQRRRGIDRRHPLRGLLRQLCASVFAESLQLEGRNFPSGERDLFMEQLGICGLVGHTSVAQWRWWPLVIGWQRASGCYGQFSDELMNSENFNPRRYGNYRRKRSEAAMSDGCLSHRTSVALDALVVYARRLIEDGLLRQQ